MCARFSLNATAEQIGRLFDVPVDEIEARYNVAPTQDVLAIVAERDGRHAKQLKWGLVPQWAKDPSIGHKLINARSESAAEKSAFRGAFKYRRCLIPASGFYEWMDPAEADVLLGRVVEGDTNLFGEPIPRKGKKRPRQPFYITPKEEPLFAFAGLWESWHGPHGEEIESATILTTEANPVVARLHDRMPAILDREDYGAWLDRENREPSSLLPLLLPYAAEKLRIWAVDPVVNDPNHESPDCVEPLAAGV